MARGKYQLSLPRAQPKLLSLFDVWWQFFFCKICRLGASQKCGFGKDFLAVPASWSSWHESTEGRGTEWGSPRETRKAAGHQAEMGMESLGGERVPLPAAQHPQKHVAHGAGTGLVWY